MKRYLYILAAIAVAFSCGKDPQPVEPPVSEGRVTLEVSSESRQLEMSEDGLAGSVLFKTKGGSVILDVLTNQDEWSYETSGEDWLEVSADDYFLTLKAEKNTADKSNSATVVIKASNDNQEVSVTLTVTPEPRRGAGSKPGGE